MTKFGLRRFIDGVPGAAEQVEVIDVQAAPSTDRSWMLSAALDASAYGRPVPLGKGGAYNQRAAPVGSAARDARDRRDGVSQGQRHY